MKKKFLSPMQPLHSIVEIKHRKPISILRPSIPCFKASFKKQTGRACRVRGNAQSGILWVGGQAAELI